MIKRTFALAAVFAVLAAALVPLKALALTDDFALSDPPRGVYPGGQDGPATIYNLSFTDVAGDFWAKQVITRVGALNLVKGEDRAFSPGRNVTNQEALAFILRAIGYETLATQRGAALSAQYPSEPAGSLWGLGYLSYARELGLITLADYNNALPAAAADPFAAAADNTGWNKNAPASRETAANWLYLAINYARPGTFPAEPMQSLFNLGDWQSVSAAYAQAVESISKAKIMTPDQYGNFNPKQPVTRAQMAQILSNLDSVYFPIAGLERRTGTVAGIRDGQAAATLTAGLQRTVYVRSADGKMDHLVCAYTDTPSPQNMTLDAVTYRAGIVSGLTALEEGDEIEYIVNPLKKSAVYVYVTKTVSVREVSGFLAGLDYENRSLTISGSGEKKFSYRLAQGLLTRQAGAEALIMSGKAYPAASLPYGAVVALRLVNDTVTEITYKGQPELVSEIRGIVLENDADLGFLTIIDNNGKRVTKQYTEGSMKVRKRQYYDQDDAVGYFVNMFPHFDYDPLETEIADVEPGDVVFLTLNRSDADVIESVSASVNYQSRYGKIRSIVRGADEFSIVVEYENKQTGSFSVAGGIFVSSGGRPITQNEIQTGDWARFLVNEAIIEPGRSLESVKEIVIEGGEHFISGLYKGSLSGVNAIQATIALEGAQELDKTGWVNYRDIANFNIKNKDVEFYDGGRRVSLDYCAKRYKNGGVTAYVATEAAYSGERVTRVTFRAGRDEALDADVALSADGGGAFEVLSRAGRIETDDGTIVRRFGRLVGGTDIEPSDYVRVVLNGGGKAAIVDITSEPDTSRVMIARGRIASVNGTSSFKTQSISQLSGTSWVYTPVQREYAIDGKTVFLNESGYSDPAAFMDYTENSVVDRVYNIVTDGSRAAFVIDAPYAYRAVRGTVYQNEDGVLRIKDVYALNENTDQWQAVSAVNNTAAVTVYPNTITARDNAVISAGALVNGDRVLIMTNRVPALTAGMAIDGYIVIVER